MANAQTLAQNLKNILGDDLISVEVSRSEVTALVEPSKLLDVCQRLKTETSFLFEQLLDVVGVDFLHYGQGEWATDSATGEGFERATSRLGPQAAPTWSKERFSVIYHLLSIQNNQRLRLQVFLKAEEPIVDSLVSVWPSANWAEREAYDLFGIMFSGHPDLRRILTDYGFVGHPFRKDFPLSGQVEARYDASAGRVVYEKVSIEPRVLVPKVIREDNRYMDEETSS